MMVTRRCVAVLFLLATSCYGQNLLDQFFPEELVSESRDLESILLSGRERTIFRESTTTRSQVSKPIGQGSCGGIFNENEGEISSPGYPVNFYPSNANCSWQIQVEEGKVIMMEFKFMDIEVGPPDCPFDGVLVVDYLGIWNEDIAPHLHGPVVQGVRDPQSPPMSLGRYCGQEQFKPFLSVTNGVRIGFYSDADSEGSGFVLSWKAVDPPGSEPSNVLYGCDFEDGLCDGWENIETDEDSFDWAFTSGQTKTEDTGPTFDHTKNNSGGKYAYIEASLPQVENDTALLSSPEMNFAEDDIEYCLEFWYHMYGDDIGSLVVGVASGDRRTIEWMESGNQGDKWLRTIIPIARTESPFKLMFAGVRGTGYAGDVAIDDIKVYGKPCAEVTWKDRLAGNNGSDPFELNPCENDSDYPCMSSTQCIADEKMCDGEFDCPLQDDESEFFCITDVTTAVPPPPEETTYYPFETTIITETTEDITTDNLITTMPEWVKDFTTFALDTTSIEEESQETTEVPEPAMTTTVISTTSQPTEEATTVEETTIMDEFTTAFTTDIMETTTDFEDITSTASEVLPPTTATTTTTTEKQVQTTTQKSTTGSAILTTSLDEIETTPSGTTEFKPKLTTEEKLTSAATTIPVFRVTTVPNFRITTSASTPSTTPITTTTSASTTTPITTATSASTTTSTLLTTSSDGMTSTSPDGGEQTTPEEYVTEQTTTVTIIRVVTSPKIRSGTKSLITAIVNAPTLAEKQTGDGDGSSAGTVTSKYVIFICLLGGLLQYFWSRP